MLLQDGDCVLRSRHTCGSVWILRYRRVKLLGAVAATNHRPDALPYVSGATGVVGAIFLDIGPSRTR
jgi:hypothetical protein